MTDDMTGGGRSRSWRQVKANVLASGASAGDQLPGPRSGAASVVVGNKVGSAFVCFLRQLHACWRQLVVKRVFCLSLS